MIREQPGDNSAVECWQGVCFQRGTAGNLAQGDIDRESEFYFPSCQDAQFRTGIGWMKHSLVMK
jgi:hypothetical protein